MASVLPRSVYRPDYVASHSGQFMLSWSKHRDVVLKYKSSLLR
ncbi:hypothetical protein [Niabella ginsengisoli]|nr:hypothetical protein [Niabella ginsengisoli]